jgi:4-hydroxy-tetrahydrodipicolinate synthase
MHEMCVAALSGDLPRARAINYQLLGLHQKLFVEANPIPVKWALAAMGHIESGIRLPLVPMSDTYHDTLRVALKEAGSL